MPKATFTFIVISLFLSLEGLCQNLTLNIQGQTDTQTKSIDSLGYTKNHKDFLSIQQELDTLQRKLGTIGFIENKLEALKRVNDSTFISIISLKHRFDTIYIYYNKNDIEKSSLNYISEEVFEDYFVLKLSQAENALKFLNTEISKKGFPFSKLKLTNLSTQNASFLRADLTLSINKQQRRIDDIVVRGYEKFPESFIKHYLKIKPNQIFDLNTIQNKTSQLNNLNFANEIKKPEVLFSKDSTTLYLYLEKSKSNAFDGFLGFGSNEETNKLQFDGYLNLNLTNNLNFGETFRLFYKSDENDQQTFEVNTSLPYLFKSPIGIDLLLRIFRKDSSFTTTNQFAKIHYQINAYHKVFGGIEAIESSNLLENTPTLPIEDYTSRFYTMAYEYIQNQNKNLLFPINTKLYIETGFGNRKNENTSTKQTQLFCDAFKIFNLNEKNSIYLRANAASLISDSYFENELLRFGGINSIRGFEENSLFASLYGVLNTEYRYQVSNSIYVHSIFDAAYFENQLVDSKQKLFGFGFGFGLLTKAGLFRFNYANGKTEDVSFNLSNSKVHLSLTSIF
ncbi:POTRA domain-containing protein [Cognatitamlana onchidii]|uniref:POTRA domain-containing protein n=1 Tax=Cognatitamlana onchidii TaxID=2562860 RepID=UPI0010A6B384|nr:POTRA domain-containing protein [Algibacter onchidii]